MKILTTVKDDNQPAEVIDFGGLRIKKDAETIEIETDGPWRVSVERVRELRRWLGDDYHLRGGDESGNAT
mgnify:CR=1 FL=1